MPHKTRNQVRSARGGQRALRENSPPPMLVEGDGVLAGPGSHCGVMRPANLSIRLPPRVRKRRSSRSGSEGPDEWLDDALAHQHPGLPSKATESSESTANGTPGKGMNDFEQC